MARIIKRTTRIWIGVGAAVAVGAAGAASEVAAGEQGNHRDLQSKSLDDHSLRLAQATMPAHQHGPATKSGNAQSDTAKPSAMQPGAATSDGEGEGADGNLDPRVMFYRHLGLIRGHLLVGDELVKEGRWDDALPHFLHPVEEIYAKILPALKRQTIRPFESQLRALSQTVQAQKADAYAVAWKTVDQRLSEAEKSIRKFVSNWPQFTVQTAMALLNTAGGEYEEAIEDGRIAKPVEYQDARGFVFWADRLLAGLNTDLGKARNESLAKTRAELAELKKIWPSPVPPPQPVKDHSAMLGDVSRVELAAGAILKP